MRKGLWVTGGLAALAACLGLGLPARGQLPGLPLPRLPGFKAPSAAPAEHKPGAEDYNRLMEILVELAWLADPATFPYFLEAHVTKGALHIRGHVPARAIRDQALKLARLNCAMTVVDDMKDSANPSTRPPHIPPEQLQRAALTALRASFPQAEHHFQIQSNPEGKVKVLGFVRSYEEKLAISQALRRLHGCVCVINQVHVAPDSTLSMIGGKARNVASRPATDPAKIGLAPLPLATAGPRPALATASVESTLALPVSPEKKAATTSAADKKLPEQKKIAQAKEKPGTTMPASAGDKNAQPDASVVTGKNNEKRLPPLAAIASGKQKSAKKSEVSLVPSKEAPTKESLAKQPPATKTNPLAWIRNPWQTPAPAAAGERKPGKEKVVESAKTLQVDALAKSDSLKTSPMPAFLPDSITKTDQAGSADRNKKAGALAMNKAPVDTKPIAPPPPLPAQSGIEKVQYVENSAKDNVTLAMNNAKPEQKPAPPHEPGQPYVTTGVVFFPEKVAAAPLPATDLMQQEIAAACGLPAQSIHVAFKSPTEVEVRVPARNQAEANQLAQHILHLPELKSYRVDVQVQLPNSRFPWLANMFRR